MQSAEGQLSAAVAAGHDAAADGSKILVFSLSRMSNASLVEAANETVNGNNIASILLPAFKDSRELERRGARTVTARLGEDYLGDVAMGSSSASASAAFERMLAGFLASRPRGAAGSELAFRRDAAALLVPKICDAVRVDLLTLYSLVEREGGSVAVRAGRRWGAIAAAYGVAAGAAQFIVKVSTLRNIFDAYLLQYEQSKEKESCDPGVRGRHKRSRSSEGAVSGSGSDGRGAPESNWADAKTRAEVDSGDKMVGWADLEAWVQDGSDL